MNLHNDDFRFKNIVNCKFLFLGDELAIGKDKKPESPIEANNRSKSSSAEKTKTEAKNENSASKQKSDPKANENKAEMKTDSNKSRRKSSAQMTEEILASLEILEQPLVMDDGKSSKNNRKSTSAVEKRTVTVVQPQPLQQYFPLQQ